MASKNNQSNLERERALARVLNSSAFSGSNALQQILKFIVEKSLAGSVDEIKEFTIATQGLGRPQDFDPKADNIVRAQMHRLRQKLEEYYSQEGAGDAVRILVPSGHYIPEFQSTPSADPPTQSREPIPPLKSEQPFGAPDRKLPSALPWGLVALLLVVVVIMGVRLSRTPASSAISSSAKEPPPSSLAPLWKPFISPKVPVIIVYSNSLFLADDYLDLYRFSRSSSHSLPVGTRVRSLVGLERFSPIHPSAESLYYWDLYTGIGEVVATGKIASLLATENQDFSVERSGLISYDNIRNSNAIFIGASAEDPILAQLPVEADLDFAGPDSSFHLVDHHPVAGRPDKYRLSRDQKTGEFRTDYALISLLPGVTPDRHIMVLGGITTLGTQAAAEFATSPAHMAVLEKMRGDSHGNPARSPYFQALLEVPIRNGAVAEINCLLIRELRNK
jgi:hypothetical protein